MNRTCDSVCEKNCIYKCVDMVFILGVFTNGVVVWRTIADRSLRTPTFIAIACLALSDALFLSLNLVKSFNGIYKFVTCTEMSFLNDAAFATVLGITWFASNGHVSIIAVIRCILVFRPLHAHVYLTNRKILIASGVVWLIGICIWGTVYLLKMFSMSVALNSVEFQLSIWGVVFFSPLVITTILHLTKCYFVRRFAQKQLSNTKSRIKTYTKMSKMIFLVILAAIALQLPRFVLNLFEAMQLTNTSSDISFHVKEVVLILFLLNSCINPVIYAFLWKKFRNSLCASTIRKRPTSSKTDHVTKPTINKDTQACKHVESDNR